MKENIRNSKDTLNSYIEGIEGDIMKFKVIDLSDKVTDILYESIDTPCDECVLLAICNKKEALNRIDKCEIIKDNIMKQSNIMSVEYDYIDDVVNQKIVYIKIFNQPLTVRLTDYLSIKERCIRLEKITKQTNMETYQSVILLDYTRM